MPPERQPSSRHDMSFSVDLSSLEAALMTEVSLAEAGIRERSDLQRWIEKYPR